MQHSAKYLIHADIRTSGVVERSDVVGAVFGQTEGLLGDELDLRDLQESSKIGRIDVHVESEGGRSFGTITIGSALDQVRTAVLAASLETIERVGPCRADCTVTNIEDARAAKRRELVDRATELLADLEEATMTSENLVDAVRQRSRVEEITEYEGVPAGPRVADSDAVIVVEGRADVRRLLRFGIRNAIAVEGTDIPDAVAQLTTERTTTVLLDGDRGGDLILRELVQIGDVDYIAFAPPNQSVEDLDRSAILSALRKKIPYEQALEASSPREAFAPTGDAVDGQSVEADGAVAEASAGEDSGTESATGRAKSEAADEEQQARSRDTGSPGDADATDSTDADTESTDSGVSTDGDAKPVDSGEPDAEPGTAGETGSAEEPAAAGPSTPQTLGGHVSEVVGAGTDRYRLLDGSFGTIDEGETDGTFDAVRDAEQVPHSIVLDTTVTQRLLDVAAQRGVGQIVALETGEFVKQPTNVRVRTADDLEIEPHA
jgi:DNA primase